MDLLVSLCGHVIHVMPDKVMAWRSFSGMVIANLKMQPICQATLPATFVGFA
jgi:hypothetical protein